MNTLSWFATWFDLKFNYHPSSDKKKEKLYTQEDLLEAYKAGWNECVDPTIDFDYFMRNTDHFVRIK